MAENLSIINNASRKEQYENLVPQIQSLIAIEASIIANLANISAALMQTFYFLWVGFYLVDNEELVLAPFQGKIACTRIKYGRGVCGTAWKEQKAQIVPNVNDFPGHIACDAESLSEIVIPIIRNNKIIGVLDVDSEQENHFSEIDAIYLQQIVNAIIF